MVMINRKGKETGAEVLLLLVFDEKFGTDIAGHERATSLLETAKQGS